jgi:hypothetical protein
MGTLCKIVGHVLSGTCQCRRCQAVFHDWSGCKCRRCASPMPEEAESHSWDRCTCSGCGRIRNQAHEANANCRCNRCHQTCHEYEEGICVYCGFRYGRAQIAVHRLGHVWYTHVPTVSDGYSVEIPGGWFESSPPEAREDLRQAEKEILEAGVDGIAALKQAIHPSATETWKHDQLICRVVGNAHGLVVDDEGSRPVAELESDPASMAHVTCKRRSRIEFGPDGTVHVVDSSSRRTNIRGSQAPNGDIRIICRGLVAGFLEDVNVSIPHQGGERMLVYRASVMKERARRLLAR